MAAIATATARRAVPIAFVLAPAAACWALVVQRMAGMDQGPGTALGTLGWFVVTWVLMMAAMMLPSLAPAAVSQPRARPGAAPAFVAGYLATWTIAGLAAYAIVEGGRSLELGFLAWDRGGRFVAAGAVLVAAGYQLTPVKDACLRRCRRRAWAPDRPLRAGVAHGSFCVGCCWALFAALLALGVMSIAWMVAIVLLVTLERLLPWRRSAARAIAVALAALAVAVAVAPADVPFLTLPGASGAMPAMAG